RFSTCSNAWRASAAPRWSWSFTSSRTRRRPSISLSSPSGISAIGASPPRPRTRARARSLPCEASRAGHCSVAELHLRARRQMDRLRLEVGAQTFGTQLAAEAGLLEAAERRGELHPEAVHAVVPGAHAPRRGEAALGVGAPGRAREPVVRVVGDPNRLAVVAVVRDQRHHRPEDLLARDLHVVAHVGEHRGLTKQALGEPPRAAAADHHARALLASRLEVALDARALALGHERTERRERRHRVADLERTERGPE